MADGTDQNPPAADTEQPLVDEGNDEADFDAAFAERAERPAGQQQEPAEDGAQAPSTVSEPDQSRSKEAPTDEVATDDTASGTEAKSYDPWTGLSPEQQSYFKRLQDSERSQRGRVGALTKKLNGQQVSRAAPAPQGTATEQQPDAEQGEAGGTIAALEAKLKETADEYPDVAGPLVEAISEVRREIAAMAGTVSKVEQDASAQELEKAYSELAAAHADYESIAADTNFQAWLGSQSEKVVDLVNSYDPREVSLALTLFKAERSAATATQAGGDGEQKAGTTATDKRARQLEGSRQVPNRGAPAAHQVPDDFDAAFAARAAQYGKGKK